MPPHSQNPALAAANQVPKNRDGTFSCPFKGCTVKSFARRYNLVSHYKTHFGIREFECGVCGREFTRRYDLTRHETIHGGPSPKNGGPSTKKQPSKSRNIKTYTKTLPNIKQKSSALKQSSTPSSSSSSRHNNNNTTTITTRSAKRKASMISTTSDRDGGDDEYAPQARKRARRTTTLQQQQEVDEYSPFGFGVRRSMRKRKGMVSLVDASSASESEHDAEAERQQESVETQQQEDNQEQYTDSDPSDSDLETSPSISPPTSPRQINKYTSPPHRFMRRSRIYKPIPNFPIEITMPLFPHYPHYHPHQSVGDQPQEVTPPPSASSISDSAASSVSRHYENEKLVEIENEEERRAIAVAMLLEIPFVG